MSKGNTTKEFIVQKAAALFNAQGYAGTSLQHIMNETGLAKGGIYRHYDSKEDIAVDAFRYSYQLLRAAYLQSFSKTDAPDVKLKKLIQQLLLFMKSPPVKGGCPIMNTAVEADDNNPVLRKEAMAAAMEWEEILTSIFEEGVKKKIFKPLNPVDEARFFFAAFEGGILFAKLHHKAAYIVSIAAMLHKKVDELKR